LIGLNLLYGRAMKPLHAVFVLILLFAIMSAISWQTWANPVIDGGREMNTPLRLLRGETIYSQVYYLYGPVAPFFNALLFKVFGIHLNVLYAAGLAGALLLVLMVFHLARGFMSLFESLLAAAAVLLLCVFKQGGNMIFPYSYAVLYGTLLGTSALAAQLDYVRTKHTGYLLAAGALSGLAFCCKLEFGIAAFASLLMLVISAHPAQRTRIAMVVLPTALIIPALIYGWLLARIPADTLIKDTFLFPGSIPSELIYYNKMKLGLNNPGRTLREMLSALALLCGVAGAISLAAIRIAGESIFTRKPSRHVCRLWWLTGVSFGLLLVHVLLFGTHWDMNPFRALPILFAAMIFSCIRKQRGIKETDVAMLSLLLISVYSLVVLARVFVRIPGGGAYGAGLLPVPIVLFVFMAVASFPIFGMPVAAERYRRTAVCLLLSLAMLGTLSVLTFRYTHNSYTWIRTPRGNLGQPPSITGSMNQALKFLARNSRSGDPILALPEGSSLNFLADRPAPLRYEIVTPGFLSEEKERLAIRDLQEKNVPYIFLFNRPTSEFGPRVFGKDYCRTLMAWIEENYAVAAVYGDDVSLETQIGDPGFFIKCLARRQGTEFRSQNFFGKP
jgi:hypothetical protein